MAGDPLVALRELVVPHVTAPVPGLPPFQGGAAGYVAYDWGLTLERLPAPRYDDLGLPDLVIGLYDWVIAWDHDASRAWLISTGHARSCLPMHVAHVRLDARRLSETRIGARDSKAALSHPRIQIPANASAFAPSHPVEPEWWRRPSS